jgi:hypothetical protein
VKQSYWNLGSDWLKGLKTLRNYLKVIAKPTEKDLLNLPN